MKLVLPTLWGVRKIRAGGAKDATPGKQDQIEILNQEMAKANALLANPRINSEERARAEVIIMALNREYGNLAVKVGARQVNMGSQGAAPVASPAPVRVKPAMATWSKSTEGSV